MTQQPNGERVIPFPKRGRVRTAQYAEQASRAFIAIARTAEICAIVAYVVARELGINNRERR